ncbi:MAG: hypothetical protein GFH25_541188n388 [Chloroflexi bacterium AL-N10]|nr:hypothetical protein [Chloroflexi bacterium AL-N10]
MVVEKDIAQVLDEAIARIHAGESVEDFLARYPEHQLALEPLLRTSLELWTCADTSLPSELEEWVDTTGLQEFSAFAQQMLPSQEATVGFTQYTSSVSDILDDALVLVQTGMSVEECLARYSEHRLALEPLIKTSTELMSYVDTSLPSELEEWVDTTGLYEFVMMAEQMTGSSRIPQSRRKYTVLTQRVVTTALVGVLIVGVVDAASASSLPSDPLYQWKIVREDINLALADSDTRRQLHIDYAQRRATEIEALSIQGVSEDSEVVARTFDSLILHTKSAVQRDTDPSQAEEEDVDEIVEQAHEIVERAQSIADELVATLPEKIQADLDNTQRGLPTARPDRVAEIATSTLVPSRTPFVRRTPTPPDNAATPVPGDDVASTTPISRVTPPVGSLPSEPGETEVVPTSGPRTTTPVESTPDTNLPAPTTFVPRTAVPSDVPITLPPTATPVPVDATQEPRPPTPDPTRIRPTEEVSPTATFTPEPPPPTAILTPEPPEPPPPTATATPEPPPPTATATPEPPPPTATADPVEPPPSTADPVEPTLEPEDPSEDSDENPPSDTEQSSQQLNVSVQPIVDCVVDNENGTFTAYFGFRNSANDAVNIAIGANNYVSPGPDDQGQPSTFEAGRSSSYPNAVFSVDFSGSSVTWHLIGQSVTASSSSAQCNTTEGESFSAAEVNTGVSEADATRTQDGAIDD